MFNARMLLLQDADDNRWNIVLGAANEHVHRRER